MIENPLQTQFERCVAGWGFWEYETISIIFCKKLWSSGEGQARIGKGWQSRQKASKRWILNFILLLGWGPDFTNFDPQIPSKRVHRRKECLYWYSTNFDPQNPSKRVHRRKECLYLYSTDSDTQIPWQGLQNFLTNPVLMHFSTLPCPMHYPDN